MALQCPKCPLRFDLAPMLADHLRTDHDVDPDQTAHLEPPSVRAGRVRDAGGGAGRDAGRDGGRPSGRPDRGDGA